MHNIALPSALLSGFAQLTREQRFQRLLEWGALTPDDLTFLRQGGIQTPELAENFVENALGYFQLPLGVATHVRVDGRDYVIPMAVEETSIIAAMSKTAKWINQHGAITTSFTPGGLVGQILCEHVPDQRAFIQRFHAHKDALIHAANTNVAASMVKRGGGVLDLSLRHLQHDETFDRIVIHLSMNCGDAMGANIMNQVLEYLKKPIEDCLKTTVTLCILSNLNEQKLTHAHVVMHNIDPALGTRLEEASRFAENDPYRAATHNKGIMNGIDPVVIATGNDWRAVEAGVHAFAARHGRYQSISRWRYHQGTLTGQLSAPLLVGTVGGVTTLHPTAQLGLRMMGIESAQHLSSVLAAVGLIQNLGAIRALCTEGITQGHMRLHINNLILATDATPDEALALKPSMQDWLLQHQRITLSDAQHLLNTQRQKNTLT